MHPPCANDRLPPPDPPAAAATARTIAAASLPESGPAYATILTVRPSANTPQYAAPGCSSTSRLPNSMWNVSPRPSPVPAHVRRPPAARTSTPSTSSSPPSGTDAAASSTAGTSLLSACRAAALALSRSALAFSAAASALRRSSSSLAAPPPTAAPSPVTNSSLTTPSCMRFALVIRSAPTCPVRPTWVPPHASESMSPIETMRTVLTGTTPPWYIRNPCSRSARPLGMFAAVTGWSPRMISLALPCMRPTCSAVSGEWCVTSSLAWSASLNAECCHTHEPRTVRADALSMCVPVWFFDIAERLAASTEQRTFFPPPASRPASPSTVWTMTPPCFVTSVTRRPPIAPRSGSCPPPLA